MMSERKRNLVSGSQDQRPSKKLRSLLVDPKMLGGSLKPVSSEVIRSDGNDLRGVWLHSDRDLDFFIWRDENSTIIKQQLCFMGIVAEWNIVEGSRTGTLNEDERTMRVAGSALIEYDEKIQEVVLDQARQICSNIESLSVADRDECSSLWLKGRGLGSHSYAGFIAKFKKILRLK